MNKIHEKKGALHKQLGISEREHIPSLLLEDIERTPIGHHVHNPTKVGYRDIPVTHLLKERVTLAETFRRSKRR